MLHTNVHNFINLNKYNCQIDNPDLPFFIHSEKKRRVINFLLVHAFILWFFLGLHVYLYVLMYNVFKLCD